MDLFILAGWVLTLLTSAALLFTFSHARYLLIKPSLWVLIAHHAIIQWAAVLASERIYTFLPDPWAFALLVHGFPLFGLIGAHLTGTSSAKSLWRRLPSLTTDSDWIVSVTILTAVSSAVMAYYFRLVPFEQTGLYAMIFNPLGAEQAREDSLKLLSDPIARYGYSLVISVAAPLLASLLVWRVVDQRGTRRVLPTLLFIVLIPTLLVVITLSGARSYAATLIVVLALLIGFRMHFSSRYLSFIPLALIVPGIPTILTIVREGLIIDVPTFATYLRDFIVQRVFYGPLDTGLWYAHYAQTNGFVGVAAIPKLASLFSVPVVNMPNTIGLTYMSTSLITVHANTGYVFAYYGYFGLLSFPISLLLLWSCDSVLWILLRLRDNMLVASIASVAVAAISFITAEYSTVLITHGFALIPLVALVLDQPIFSRRGAWIAAAPQSAT